MCFGTPKIDTSYQDFQIAEAERARADEEARQARIDDGLKQIAAVFEGGTYGGETFEGTAPILAQREQAQRDFYLPQLDIQHGKAQDNLAFALARAGLLNSTVAGERQADLAQEYSLERGSVLSRIASDIAGTKTNLNQNRSSIEAGLRASGDASAAANQALQAATTFRQDQPQLDALGPLFYGVSQGIGAVRNGAETARIRSIATPNPLRTNSGRVIA